MFNFKEFNIADWFSFYRIMAAPFLILLIILDQRTLFSWFLVISFSTDAIDGFLARTLKITTSRGSFLDSFGDQLTFFAAIIGMLVFEWDFVVGHYKIIIIALIPYFIQTFMAYRKYGKASSFHTYLAKLTAVLQGIFIITLFLIKPVEWLFYLTIAMGLIEIIEEIIMVYMYDQWVNDVRGIWWALKDPRRKKS
ncbi:MAG: CDP-alcohol phosphatidyltransferase family protein [Flavobacteriia bacterium]|nr:MAG: CDP-alcohol phosphatidyltransferase family protein [Flavobacteriia bacterium]